jgi:cysteine synthase A
MNTNFTLDFPWLPKELNPLNIGNTPVVKLNSSHFKNKNIFVKLEEYNSGGNVKMRPAMAMVARAEQLGILKPFTGQTILESSGGSMGISLAIIGALRGYKIKLVLPDNYNPDRIRQLPIYGAEVLLSDHTTGNDSHFRLARQLASENPNHYYIDQLSNPANPEIHYRTTGNEIVKQLSHIDYFVCGIGSGGSITGIGRKIKEAYPNAKIIAVQPKGCDVLKGTAIVHKIQGWAAGVLPTILDQSLIDDVLDITYEQSMQLGCDLVKNEGLFVGISSCANILAADMLSNTVGDNKRIITLAPDSGHIYLSHYLNIKNTNHD